MVLRRGLAVVLLVCASACQSPPPAPPTQRAPTIVAAPTLVPAPAPPSVSATRIEALNAANAAFGAGDLTTAAGLYERVVNTPPAAGEAAAATQAIDDYAEFRAIVALLADGREADARRHLDALQQRDPNAPLARLGSQLWDQYGMTGQLRGACAQLQPQIATQAGAALTAVQSLGVAADAASLCSAPPGASP